MKVVVCLIVKPDAERTELARMHREELLVAWSGLETGIVRAIHALHERPGAMLELEVSTIHDAKQFVDALPYVQRGLLDVWYYPVKPFVGFKDLFAAGG